MTVTALLLLCPIPLSSASLSDPAVDAYNVRVGTQTFAGRYQFTTNSLFVETAEAIRDLGSDVIKFYHGKDYPVQYRITLPANVTNLVTLARDEPSCRFVLNMPFRHFVMWAYPFSTSDAGWANGYTSTLRANDYREIYDLTRFFLTNYNNSGKSFYLGHWEGDWYLLPNYNTATNPTPTAIQGMIDWLNNRQKAIDDAKRDTPHRNVDVFGYAEANRVRDAMSGNPSINQRVINKVVPYVTNLDFVSWSSYDGMSLSSQDLTSTLNYMESRLPTNKAAVITGRRVWIGEYGWGASSSDAQEPLNRSYIQRLLPWGPKFILFWEIYNNEPNRSFWLIDSNQVKVASWDLHHRFINNARLLTARFKQANGRLPNDSEFADLLTPMLDKPLPPLISLSISNGSASMRDARSAEVKGTLAQGIYGDDGAAVRVFWGEKDGGAIPAQWEHRQDLGLNTNFAPTVFTAQLTNLAPQTNYYFRYYASNATGEAWAPASTPFSTVTLSPGDYGSRLKISLSGYQGTEVLSAFPVLVKLGTHLQGFSYRQFASPAGEDLRFTDANGLTVIPHEIDEWNTNGISSVWVRIPTLFSPADFIWACWGNPLATNTPVAPADSVWSADFQLVWHLQQRALPYWDSTGQYSARAGVAPASVPGLVGRAAAFNGSSQYLSAGPVNLNSAFTISAWVKVDPTVANIQTICANKSGGWNADGFALYVNSYNTSDYRVLLETGNGVTGLTASTAPNVIVPGSWQYVVAAVDRANGMARLFVNGADRTEQTAVRNDFANQSTFDLGRFPSGAFYFKGQIDELRVENEIRSVDWIATAWATTRPDSTMASYTPVTQVFPRLSFVYDDSPGLSWPANGVGFLLCTATNLLAPVFWSPTGDAPTLLDTQWRVALSADNSASRFFRLEFR